MHRAWRIGFLDVGVLGILIEEDNHLTTRALARIAVLQAPRAFAKHVLAP
jgi:hypothetical protein